MILQIDDVQRRRHDRAFGQHWDKVVAACVSYVGRFMTLHPGDVLTTGTPQGVGLGPSRRAISQAAARCDLESPASVSSFKRCAADTV